jgi:hypothetical protein
MVGRVDPSSLINDVNTGGYAAGKYMSAPINRGKNRPSRRLMRKRKMIKKFPAHPKGIAGNQEESHY